MTDQKKSTDLDVFFHSRSVAVFGASTNPNKSGYKLVQNLIDHNYKGKIYPINPKGGEILGRKLYTSLSEVEGSVELAILYIPSSKAIQVLKDCIQKGVKGAIIEAAGFGEVGEEGKKLKEQIIALTENFTKIRVLGPNCTGITFVEKDGEGFFSSFIPMGKTKAGSLAIVSQSGFINGAYYPDFTSRNPNLGVRYVITIGNKMDLDENDILEYLIHDKDLSTIGMYIESFRDVRRFIKLCNEAYKNYGKRIVLLRSGLSSIGSNATTSHTGALAEKSELIKAVIAQSHCIQADDFWDLFNITRTLSFMKDTNIKPIYDASACVVTISGAAGAIMADWSEKYGVKIPLLDDETYSNLAKLYPPWMAPNKYALIDYWPAVENAKGDYQRILLDCIDIGLSSPRINAAFVAAYHNATAWKVDWNLLKEIMARHQKPIFIWLFGEYHELVEAEKIFQEIKIPIYHSEREIVQTFKKIVQLK
ncbi:CoA-binding protein [Candidatus Lokiarchaeum ossiferum]|uniref:CoA-binding protein n=1 Tax=Candidatus Lokiarchaeum ossiferum TaxID=2951803 RepID=UPI00352E4981